MINRFILNKNTKLHVMDNDVKSSTHLPVLIVPGLVESAEDYSKVLEHFKDRLCIAISFRGRGKSDAPEQGYGLEDHLGDIEAVVNEFALDAFIIYGFSRGVSYAIAYALNHPQRVKGIILGDYPGMHTRLPETWVEQFINLPPWRGKTTLEWMDRSILEQIQNESHHELFYESLKSLSVPMLLIKGEKRGSLLTEDQLDAYRESVSELIIVRFENAGHDLYAPGWNHFINTLEAFFEKYKF